ncbi:hypothetical protein ACQ4LE_009234 [Meloidogyne hapla]
MSDENREQLLSLLGDEDGFDENNFCEDKGEVRVRRQKILQKRKIKRHSCIQRPLIEDRALHNSKFDLMDEQFKIIEPISEEREQKIMKILNKIINNEDEEKNSEKQEEMEKEVNIEEECVELDDGNETKSTEININLINLNSKIQKENKYIYEEKVFDEENGKEEEMSLFEWTIENDGEIDVIPSIELSEMLGEISVPHQDPDLSLKVSSTSSTLSSTILTTKTTFQSNYFDKIINKISNSNFWIFLQIPYKINYFDYCQHFLIICSKNRKYKPYFMMISSLKALQGKRCSPHWNKLGIDADGISMNDDGSRLWRIWNGAGFSPISKLDLIGPSSIFSKNSQWYQMTSRNEGFLLQVELTNKHAWYLTDRGVFVQMFLPDSGIGYWYRTQENDELDKFVQITATDEAVWVLNSFGMVAARVGLRRCPMGVDWAYLDNQPKKFVSISIYERIGFGLDNQGVIWLINGVGLESPFGVGNWSNCSPLQVNSIPKMSPINDWRLSVGSIGIFVNVGTALLYLSEPFIGKDADEEILLSKAREMPERTLSGGSATSWCELGR